jgi:hypothetical protein
MAYVDIDISYIDPSDIADEVDPGDLFGYWHEAHIVEALVDEVSADDLARALIGHEEYVEELLAGLGGATPDAKTLAEDLVKRTSDPANGPSQVCDMLVALGHRSAAQAWLEALTKAIEDLG